MESIEKRLRTSTDRINQCRICLKSSRTQNKLTEELKNKFLDVTQTELQENDKLSNFLCPKCTTTLKNAHLYRQELITTQEKLLKELSNFLLPELINLKQEKIEFDELFTNDHSEQETQVKKEENESINLEFDRNSFDSLFAESLPLEEQKVKKRVRKKVIFKCDFEGCDEEVKGKRQYNVHRKQHEPPVVKKKIRNTSYKKPKAMCPVCGVIRAHKQSLQSHIDAVHKKLKKYICDHCGYFASVRTALQSHMKHHHMDQSLRIKYFCDKCNFETFYRDKLRRHENFEHLGLAVTCHCGKLFKDKYALQVHVNTVHLKIKNHICTTCGRDFFGRSELNNHITMAHTEDKTYQFSCDECGKQFYTRRQLQEHSKYHTDIKYPCTEPGCDRSYITKKKLAKHMKVHTGKRDLICHICDKAYFYMKDLQRHLDVAHNQTTYYCPLCSVTNNRKDYLGNHIKSAHPHISHEEKSKMLATVKFTKNSV